MRRIADLCGVKIHTYSMTPGTIHVTLYPALQAKLQLFIECMDGAMPSSLRTVVTCHDTSCTCETCNPPAVLTLDELRLREAQATPTRAAAFASAAARANEVTEHINGAGTIAAAGADLTIARALGLQSALVAGVSPIEAPLHVVDSRSYLCSRCTKPVVLGAECTCTERADALADACGTLTTQNTELLAENARLRRELERGKPKPKPVDRTTAWQPTLATGLIPRRGR